MSIALETRVRDLNDAVSELRREVASLKALIRQCNDNAALTSRPRLSLPEKRNAKA